VKEFFNLTWKYWVMFLLLSAAVQAAWYYLKEQRTYREQDSKLMVRHGKLGKWLEVSQHLANHHSERGERL
jgi:hypothetical protein